MTCSKNSPKIGPSGITKSTLQAIQEVKHKKFVRFTIAALLFILLGFLAYMTTI
jgi:hypothetical protein